MKLHNLVAPLLLLRLQLPVVSVEAVGVVEERVWSKTASVLWWSLLPHHCWCRKEPYWQVVREVQHCCVVEEGVEVEAAETHCCWYAAVVAAVESSC